MELTKEKVEPCLTWGRGEADRRERGRTTGEEVRSQESTVGNKIDAEATIESISKASGDEETHSVITNPLTNGEDSNASDEDAHCELRSTIEAPRLPSSENV